MKVPNPEYRNSAGRLIALLQAAADTTNARDVAGFGSSPTDPYRQQRDALHLSNDLYHAIETFKTDLAESSIDENQRRFLLEGLKGIDEVVFSVRVNGRINKPSDAEFSLLRMCALQLAEEVEVTEDDISRIRASVDNLRELIEKGQISPTLRKALLELIRLTEDAISRFNICGARALKRAFKSMLADAAELYSTQDSDRKKQELVESRAWSLIKHHLRILDAVASKALKYRPLLADASRLFLGGSNGDDGPAD